MIGKSKSEFLKDREDRGLIVQHNKSCWLSLLSSTRAPIVWLLPFQGRGGNEGAYHIRNRGYSRVIIVCLAPVMKRNGRQKGKRHRRGNERRLSSLPDS